MSLEKQTKTQSYSMLSHHDPRFDWVRDRSHSFVVDNLGLAHSIGKESLAVIHEHRDKITQRLGASASYGGGYNPDIREAIVMANPDEENPEGASHKLVSKAVHEFIHSATEGDEHKYWLEQLPGIGEAFYLQDLVRQGRRKKVSDFTLKRAGVELLVPGAFRYYDSKTLPGANSNQGLIAATGFSISQEASDHRGRDVLLASAPGDRSHYEALKASYDALKPGLAREVESFPQTTEGIMQATAIVHEEGRKQGIVPSRR